MKRYSILYAILFSVYPVLFLFRHNNGWLASIDVTDRTEKLPPEKLPGPGKETLTH
jgi:hypothetical protein